MYKLLMTAMVTAAVGCFANQAKAADAYDALLAYIDYLEQDDAVWDEHDEAINSGLFDSMSDALQVGNDYAAAMAPPAPYDDESVVMMAVTDVLNQRIAALESLAEALQSRIDANDAALAGLNFEAAGQYDDAVAAYQTAAYDESAMGFGMFSMQLWSLSFAVDNANYWLANWLEEPGMCPPPPGPCCPPPCP